MMPTCVTARGSRGSRGSRRGRTARRCDLEFRLRSATDIAKPLGDRAIEDEVECPTTEPLPSYSFPWRWGPLDPWVESIRSCEQSQENYVKFTNINDEYAHER